MWPQSEQGSNDGRSSKGRPEHLHTQHVCVQVHTICTHKHMHTPSHAYTQIQHTHTYLYLHAHTNTTHKLIHTQIPTFTLLTPSDPTLMQTYSHHTNHFMHTCTPTSTHSCLCSDTHIHKPYLHIHLHTHVHYINSTTTHIHACLHTHPSTTHTDKLTFPYMHAFTHM